LKVGDIEQPWITDTSAPSQQQIQRLILETSDSGGGEGEKSSNVLRIVEFKKTRYKMFEREMLASV
jgi:hypothetical protein